MAERAVEFIGLAHVDHLDVAQVFLEPVRLDFPDAAEGVRKRSPVGIERGGLLRLAALEIRRHGDVHLLRMRQAEVGHVADEVVLADRLGKPRVVELLLADAGDGEAAVVVAGIDQAAIGQREDLAAHRAVQRARVALLEIGAPAAADEERIAGERHRAVVEHVGGAAAGVAGRGARFQMLFAERDLLGGPQIKIGALGTTRRRDRDAAAELLLEEPGAGDVVGMHVRLEGELELEAELLKKRRVAPRLLEHRVDQQRLARGRVGQKIRVC